MEPIAIAFFVVVPTVSFALGVVFHKYVISEATAIKNHVTAEVAQVRGDIASLLTKAAAKL